MRKYVHLGLALALLLICWNAFPGKEKSITKEEAERFALEQAAKDGYQGAEVWERFNHVTSEGNAFSIARNRFVHVWQVYLNAAGHPAILNTPAVNYDVDRKDGTIVSSVKGLLQVGMDLKLSDIQLDDLGNEQERGVSVAIRNEGKTSYFIE
ncbi:hypothetical protein [Paenibacillus sacheonensis]|uniref:Uncharacterized protein n=1 Tax=Paenibacillus sacheonensis TaxID=742054 RepID=A0A7X4YPK6_9BACL|nr:hypothetical protein [Paenibacillus sacheonensis]MBM7565007.1 hypothetical protein [Paenibacillus sacheonensis]NBC70207.1 hypothetical protein [Paenibacillus sacheonensis]